MFPLQKEMAVLGLVLLQRASSGVFDVAYKNFKLAGRDYTEEVLVLPCVALKVVQDAIRIVLEVVFSIRFHIVVEAEGTCFFLC